MYWAREGGRGGRCAVVLPPGAARRTVPAPGGWVVVGVPPRSVAAPPTANVGIMMCQLEYAEWAMKNMESDNTIT
jgi:hypothetical protein